jgi:hypothetical protein
VSAPDGRGAGGGGPRIEGEAARDRRAAIEAALAELAAVVGGIVATAEEVSCRRCPYMNVARECTAEFACINQVSRPGRERLLCSGQHRINFSRPTSEWSTPALPPATSP